MSGLIWRKSGVLLAAWVIAAVSPVLLAQGTPTFEVATVRLTDPNKPGHSLMMSTDKFWTQAQTIRALVAFAYGYPSEQQVSGGPGWVGSAQFDIEAKEDQETVERQKKMSRDARTDEVRAMVRELLAERFKLKVHHETKELPVYALSIAKGGLKITPLPTDAPEGPAADAAAKTPNRGSGIRMDGRGNMEGIKATTEIVAMVLGREPEVGGRLVQDKTGLTDKYDFKLHWTPDAGMNGDSTESAAVSLFTALQEQLGLKLESTKGAVDTIVIDAAQMPTEN